jgi:hypothetical protein
MSKKTKAEAGADDAANLDDAEVSKVADQPTAKVPAFDHAAFRRGIAAVVPGSRPFGSMPAAKMRLEEALNKVVSGLDAVKSARAILEDLKTEKVTGSDVTGAESVLGEELEAFESLISDAETAHQSLRGEG